MVKQQKEIHGRKQFHFVQCKFTVFLMGPYVYLLSKPWERHFGDIRSTLA